MPIEDARQFLQDQGVYGRVIEMRFGAQPAAPAPSGGRVLRAAFGLENTAAAGFRLASRWRFDDEEGFSPFDRDQYDTEDYPLYIFEGSGSVGESDMRKQDFDEEVKNRETIANAGVAGFAASITAGVVDPINAVPVGAALNVGRIGLKVGRVGRIAQIAATGAAANALAEVPLFASQFLRTPQESLTNILFGAMFGGLLGAGAEGFSKVTNEIAMADARVMARSAEQGAEATRMTGKIMEARRSARDAGQTPLRVEHSIRMAISEEAQGSLSAARERLEVLTQKKARGLSDVEDIDLTPEHVQELEAIGAASGVVA